jgi:hypothetical protein
MLILHRKNF